MVETANKEFTQVPLAGFGQDSSVATSSPSIPPLEQISCSEHKTLQITDITDSELQGAYDRISDQDWESFQNQGIVPIVTVSRETGKESEVGIYSYYELGREEERRKEEKEKQRLSEATTAQEKKKSKKKRRPKEPWSDIDGSWFMRETNRQGRRRHSR